MPDNDPSAEENQETPSMPDAPDNTEIAAPDSDVNGEPVSTRVEVDATSEDDNAVLNESDTLEVNAAPENAVTFMDDVDTAEIDAADSFVDDVDTVELDAARDTNAEVEVPVVLVDDDAPTVEVEVAQAEEDPEPTVEIPVAADETTRYKRGDLVEAVIVRTAPTAIMVDMGEGATGIIPGRELENMMRQSIEDLKEGEKVTVYVVNPSDHQGNIVLSINRAIEELNWKEAEEYRANQDVYDGNIAGYNKGGLIVRFGRLRGFVPQSQISDDRRRMMEGETPEERYGAMVNETIAVKVMEVDRSRNRLILSERAAYREQREKRKETLINKLTPGQITEGRVVSLEDFGAFVDVGGAEGLVHLTEISWKHITHPREVLTIGQTVRVEVISVDRERKRIGLSIKRQEADPWDEVATAYGQGKLVQATVTKLTKFGAFARLVDAPDIEGLIHISELSDQRVTHPREVVEEGEKLTLRVVKIDVKNRRLGLSLKRVNSAEYLDMDMQNAPGADDESASE